MIPTHFHTFLSFDLILLHLGKRYQFFLLSDAVLASEVKGKDHGHDKHKEDSRPYGCKISESVLGDPEHKAYHNAEYAADDQQHDGCIEKAFGPSERDVFLGNSSKFRFKRAQFSTVVQLFNFESEIILGFVIVAFLHFV